MGAGAIQRAFAVLLSSGVPFGVAFAWRAAPGAGGPVSSTRPVPAQEYRLAGVRLNPTSVVGGNRSTGTVLLASSAPSGGLVITLSSSNTGVASVPPNVTIPTSATSATFAVTTTPVASTSSVTITARLDAMSRSATLSVTAALEPGSLNALSLTPSTVEGGSSTKGTILLTSAAPSGGLVVALASSNPAIAAVPERVTVPQGATRATFSVTTNAVTESTPVRISGTAGGITRAATLTANPIGTYALPSPSLVLPEEDARFGPGQHILFDWSDVSGAVSYTLEIDDEDTFSTPLREKTNDSQFSASTLPTRRLWWRARGDADDGSPGAWSSVRSFEIED